jgi:hypothetical protein
MNRFEPPDHRGPDAVAGLRMRLERRSAPPALPDLPPTISTGRGRILPCASAGLQKVSAPPEPTKGEPRSPKPGLPAHAWWRRAAHGAAAFLFPGFK